MYIPVKFEGQISTRVAEINPTTFRKLNLQERHLEEYIRRNIGDILEGETLLVVGQQVRNSGRGISDLTAVDSDGNIVLIEIKRDLDDITHRAEAFEMQAIRYAASYATIKTPDELVDLVFSEYVERNRGEFDLGQLTPSERARRDLAQFLESNKATRTFNQKQRILLIASAFDDQTLSAVAWLISNDVDISCVTIQPVFIGQDGFLQIERVLPPPKLDEFYVDLVAAGPMPVTAAKRVRQKSGGDRVYLPRMDKLFEWGIVVPNDTLSIRNYPDSTATAVDIKNVHYRGRTISYMNWGKEVTGWSSINIYEWATLERVGRTLDELRAEKMAAIAAESVAAEDEEI